MAISCFFSILATLRLAAMTGRAALSTTHHAKLISRRQATNHSHGAPPGFGLGCGFGRIMRRHGRPFGIRRDGDVLEKHGDLHSLDGRQYAKLPHLLKIGDGRRLV
jgi:hypothetical protein